MEIRDDVIKELRSTFNPRLKQSKCTPQAFKKREELLRQLFPNTRSYNHKLRLLDAECPDWRGYEVEYLETSKFVEGAQWLDQ